MTPARALMVGVLSLSVFGLPGCGGLFHSSQTATITLDVASDANADSALAVDVVAVYDTALLKALLALPASGWFQTGDQLQRDYPEGMTVWSWQVVPGFSPRPRTVSAATAAAYDVVVFAAYETAGDHRARIGTLTDVTLHLQRNGFTVSARP